MKKMILTTLLTVAMIAGNLFASQGNISLLSENPVKSTNVTFTDVNKGATVYIKDGDGKTLYYEKIEKEGTYSKRFILSKLPENRYYFEVNKEDEITILPFEVGKDYISLKEDLKREIIKPQLTMHRDQVYLLIDVKEDQSPKVEIFYEGWEPVYSNEIKKNGMLTKKFDFSSSIKGAYLFHFTYEDRVFTQYVNIM